MDNKSTIPLYPQEYVSTLLSRIAELEASETKLIEERDHAEDALSDMFEAATGERPEWSNWFGFRDAVDVVANLHDESNYPKIPEGCVVVPLVPTKEMRLQIHPFAETTCMNCGSNVVVDCVENALLSWEDMLAAAPKLDGCK